MSTGLSVYAISLDDLAGVPGSRDPALVDAVIVGSEYRFSQVDAMADRFEDEEDRPPTCRDALRRLIDGEDLRGVPGYHGYVYGYAFEGICSHLGEEMDPVDSISATSDWVDEVDRFLAEVEVPLSLTDLVFGGSPIRIPEPDDCPSIGRWSPEQVARALGPLRGVLLEHAEDDPESTVLLIRRWVEFASKRTGLGLVGFLS